MPGINVTVDEEDVVSDEGGELGTSVVLVGLLDLEARLEVLAINVLAEVDPVLDRNHVTEGLSSRVGGLEVSELRAGLVGPLTHRTRGGSILSLSDHVGVAAVQARQRRPEVVGDIDVSIEGRHALLDVGSETTAGGSDVVDGGLVVVLNGTLPVTHEVLHEGRAIQIRVERFADLELGLQLRTAAGSRQLLLDDLSGRRNGSITSGTGPVGQRLVNNLEVLVEVKSGLNRSRRSDRTESNVRILHAEESGQSTRVAATESNDGGVVSLVLLTDVEDELSSISEGLLGGKPLKVISVEIGEGLRVTIVAMLNTDLEGTVLRGIHRHGVTRDDASRLGTFSSKLQEDGAVRSGTRPVAVLDPVALSPGTVILMVVMIETLRVSQGLSSKGLSSGDCNKKVICSG